MYRVIKSLRSLETETAYQSFLIKPKEKNCFLCFAKPIIDFKHWSIVENQYPYDGVGTMSHILTIKNHKKEEDFTQEEKDELIQIKKEVGQSYDMIIENSYHNQSIPEHFHLHLLVLKERKVEMENPHAVGFFNTKNLT